MSYRRRRPLWGLYAFETVFWLSLALLSKRLFDHDTALFVGGLALGTYLRMDLVYVRDGEEDA